MVARLMDWSCKISCLIIGLSKGLMMELGGIVGLKARLGKSTLVELGKLGELGLVIVVPGLPSIKYYFRLSTFFVA
jgi:hypothetical protein